MKSSLLIFLSFLLTSTVCGQYLRSPEHRFTFTLASNGNQQALSLNWNHVHGIGKKKNFRMGYGLRYTQNWGGSSTFTTAPAELTSGQTGLGVIFSDYVIENLDTLGFSTYSVGSLNAGIFLNYRIGEKWEIEFNIDAVGFSFGREQNATYTTSKASNFSQEQAAAPTSLNLLLTSDNDIGSLNSELLIRYRIHPQWSLQAGPSFLFTEYTTKNKLYLDNARFRNKALMGMFGVSYHPFRS
ncbi:MAG: hypothetical protein LPK45_09715 [Bacteroidota bacterium]|nr:hypothetical protein [Bacteroidota bacterium]MDX5431366.1 hypothetical protein [Bacteroidota bacterium]MDX5470096.1 hypothetical protein [Bacteroidota bacterium]